MKRKKVDRFTVASDIAPSARNADCNSSYVQEESGRGDCGDVDCNGPLAVTAGI
jgi:hypothetical protein